MLRVFESRDALADAAADLIIQVGLRDAAERGEFHLVLAGGDTPKPVYELLADRAEIDRAVWYRAHSWWGDERCVPPDDPDSNYGMARAALLNALKLPEERIHRIPAEAGDLDAACAAYSLAFPERPDMMLLGMGADGHTAAVFPGAPELGEAARRFVPVEGPKPPTYRISASPLVLASARNTLVVVTGAEKAEALERVFAEEGRVKDTPARLVRGAAWFADAPAAERALEHVDDIKAG